MLLNKMSKSKHSRLGKLSCASRWDATRIVKRITTNHVAVHNWTRMRYAIKSVHPSGLDVTLESGTRYSARDFLDKFHVEETCKP